MLLMMTVLLLNQADYEDFVNHDQEGGAGDSGQFDPKKIEWVNYHESHSFCKPSNFIGQLGINADIPDPTDVMSIFQLFITDELIDMITDQTNISAQNFIANEKLKLFSRFQGWKPIKKSEIFLLIVVYVMHGLIWKLEVDKYYTKIPLFSTPGFSAVLPHKRLKLLSHFLHFTNNVTPQTNKKLHKIRPVLDYVNNKFSTVYTPLREVAVDESLLLRKGQLSFVQFIRIKWARFSIKTYILSESSTGYIYKFIIYTGSETEIVKNPNYGHARNVVLTLMSGKKASQRLLCKFR